MAPSEQEDEDATPGSVTLSARLHYLSRVSSPASASSLGRAAAGRVLGAASDLTKGTVGTVRSVGSAGKRYLGAPASAAVRRASPSR